jgi:hypothetical protein
MALKQKEGIVVKVTKNYIVLMCADGMFKNIRRSETQIPLIGERFFYKEKEISPSWFKYAGIACIACVLVLVLFVFNMFQTVSPQPVYIVALDINPSLEVHTDKDLKTIGLFALNKSGEKIVDGIDYKGKPLPEVVDLIIERSVRKDYLKKGEKGLITVAVIPMEGDGRLKGIEIKDTIDNSLVKHAALADVSIAYDKKETYEEARTLGLSVNKYKLYRMLKDKGIHFTVEEIKEKSIKDLMKLDSDQSKNKMEETRQSSSGFNKESANKAKTEPSNDNGINLKSDSVGGNNEASTPVRPDGTGLSTSAGLNREVDKTKGNKSERPDLAAPNESMTDDVGVGRNIPHNTVQDDENDSNVNIESSNEDSDMVKDEPVLQTDTGVEADNKTGGEPVQEGSGQGDNEKNNIVDAESSVPANTDEKPEDEKRNSENSVQTDEKESGRQWND